MSADIHSSQAQGEGQFLMDDEGSIPTADLPTSSGPITDKQAAMLVNWRENQRRDRDDRVQAPHVPHGDKHMQRSRPGWVVQRDTNWKTQAPVLICHVCYGPDHTARRAVFHFVKCGKLFAIMIR